MLRPWRARACTRAQVAKGSIHSPPDDDVGSIASSPMSIPPRRGRVGDFSMFDLVHFYMIADTLGTKGKFDLTPTAARASFCMLQLFHAARCRTRHAGHPRDA